MLVLEAVAIHQTGEDRCQGAGAHLHQDLLQMQSLVAETAKASPGLLHLETADLPAAPDQAPQIGIRAWFPTGMEVQIMGPGRFYYCEVS